MSKRASNVVAVSLLVLLAVLAGGAAWRDSVTVDEVAHVGAGLSYLQRFDLRLNPEHPPLAKALAALPLALSGAKADYNGPEWKIGTTFGGAFFSEWIFGESVIQRWNKWQNVLFWARLPMLLLTVLLGFVMYRCARRLGGYWGALLCLAAFVGTPALLAFGPLVITDVPVTLTSLLALWTMGELWVTPSRKNILLFGLALASALLTKFTGLLLLPIAVILFIQSRFWPIPGEPSEKSDREAYRAARWRAVFLGWLIAFAVSYAFYFVLSWNQPTDSLSWLPAPILYRPLMPFWIFLRGLFMMLITGLRPTYILGHAYRHGVPFYFPVVFAFKSTLAFLLLLLLSAAVCLFTTRARKRGTLPHVIDDRYRPHWRIILVALWSFLTICILSQMDISIRHFLVPMLLLILLLAPVPRLISLLPNRRVWGLSTGVLAVAGVVTVVLAYPNYMPFVNSLSLGRPAYQLMNDSNVSWDGALPAVQEFASKHQMSSFNLDWAGLADPRIVAPGAVTWDCQAPSAADAGKVSIVAAVSILENHNCGWLERYPHEAIAGGEMYAFQLPPVIPATGAPGGPPSPADRKLMWGMPIDLRAFALNVEGHPERVEAATAQALRIMQGPQQNRQ